MSKNPYNAPEYDHYGCNGAVLQAIDELATDTLPARDDYFEEDGEWSDDCNRSCDAYRMCMEPTEDEEAAVLARAWELVSEDTDTLRWGAHLHTRPAAAGSQNNVVVDVAKLEAARAETAQVDRLLADIFREQSA